MTRFKKANQLHGGLKAYGILRNVTANCETGNFERKCERESGNAKREMQNHCAKREIAKRRNAKFTGNSGAGCSKLG